MLPSQERKSLDELILRVKVNSVQGDKVRENLPMTLVKFAMEMGVDISATMGGVDALKNLDIGKIMDLVERGAIGKLVEEESADGERVKITL